MATPYMNLSLPTPTVTLGPDWAEELNTALESVDSHDHTSGKGRPITTAAMNIDADLEMNGFRLQNVPSLQVNELGSPVSGVGYENSLSSDGDLWFTNGAGIPVQLTSGGSIISTPTSLETVQYDVIAADLIIGAGDDYVFLDVDTTAARNITIPLASSVSSGRLYIIHDKSSNSETFNITISASGSDTIDGAASVTVNSNSATVMLVGNGVDAYRLA